jgi:hypothetical protein
MKALHLVELVDQHVRVLLGGVAAADDRRLVVQFDRIGHRQQPPLPPCAAAFHPERLLVAGTPVEYV